MIRKVYASNQFGTIVMSIPADFVRKMGLTGDSNVNIELVGNTLHVTKVCLQGV
ncbi:hypothetical protein [Methanosarcina mazei]|uniref:hypothetical protein n=1 Tax=Methanosarcina mazei TaxID=2209 RepID=UPI000A89315A|nr:hypothetical protein [Methanosarcina mazei]